VSGAAAAEGEGAIADSCALIAFLTDPDPWAAMPNAYGWMRHRAVYVPPLVVLEVAGKMQTGALPKLPIDLPAALRQRGFLFLPMTWEVADLAAKLPPIHKDPIDRALVAHSMAQKMPVLTCDTGIPHYGIQTIW
jgi:PIN domain nuclease of toxin-antitoxin system